MVAISVMTGGINAVTASGPTDEAGELHSDVQVMVVMKVRYNSILLLDGITIIYNVI